MTPKQISHYWHLWNAACLAQHWTTKAGLTTAQISELRHQQHAAALGQDKSMKALTNPEFDLVKAHFQLLANDTDLSAATRLADPGIGDRKRLLWSIEHLAPSAYTRKIALDKFRTPHLDELDIPQLTMLRNTLANRAHKHRHQPPKPAYVNASRELSLATDDTNPF